MAKPGHRRGHNTWGKGALRHEDAPVKTSHIAPSPRPKAPITDKQRVFMENLLEQRVVDDDVKATLLEKIPVESKRWATGKIAWLCKQSKKPKQPRATRRDSAQAGQDRSVGEAARSAVPNFKPSNYPGYTPAELEDVKAALAKQVRKM